jgi:hypothetical protein
MVCAAGILAGTSFPNSRRLSVGTKSPLASGIREANSGGSAARKMGRRPMAIADARGLSPVVSRPFWIDRRAPGT